jgi:AhpD family alkylhydroperoxidase
MNIHHGFDRRIFTAGTYLSDIGFLIWNLPKIISAIRNKDITRKFVEKIMNVTSAVNGCVYCQWFHAKQAISSGISEEEIKNMMKLQFQADAMDFELMAMLYAQHFAETNRKPDPDMTKRLFDYYGKKTANHIILMIRIILFGNLCGNTWDAVISRLKGKPAPDSSIIFEIAYFLMNFIFWIPVMVIKGMDKKAIQTT